jgi:hypothetical protein
VASRLAAGVSVSFPRTISFAVSGGGGEGDESGVWPAQFMDLIERVFSRLFKARWGGRGGGGALASAPSVSPFHSSAISAQYCVDDKSSTGSSSKLTTLKYFNL